MSTVLVIGAGGVGSVAVHKMAMNSDVFTDITLASRREEKCKEIAENVFRRTGHRVHTAELDADRTADTIKLIERVQPELVVNLALPYQDLAIMDACLETGVHYLDTANYEPRDQAKFEYSWQWDYQERFEKAGIMALLGSGFDPGVTNVFTSWVRRHHIPRVETLDIFDCNAGDHGHPFATNFNPEINIREVTGPVRHWDQGKWVESQALSYFHKFDFPEIGNRNAYMMYHEELESLVKHFPEIHRARFWMTFSEEYINHVKVLENVGMTSIHPVEFEGMEIVPLQFLKATLPEPSKLAGRTKGKTCIGNVISGTKDGCPKTVYIYNVCDHDEAFKDVGAQAVSYTTGVPAMIGSMLMLKRTWMKPGVFNMEQLNPDPFMELLNQHGLPWKVKEMDHPLTF